MLYIWYDMWYSTYHIDDTAEADTRFRSQIPWTLGSPANNMQAIKTALQLRGGLQHSVCGAVGTQVLARSCFILLFASWSSAMVSLPAWLKCRCFRPNLRHDDDIPAPKKISSAADAQVWPC